MSHRSRRCLTVLGCAVSACALSAPPALAGQPTPSNGHGVVLSLTHHGVRLVDRGHRVGDVSVTSMRGLRSGDVVTVQGGRAHVGRHVRKIAFLARVKRSSRRRAMLTLGDGSSFKLLGGHTPHGRGARSASSMTVSLEGLRPGQTVLVTIAADERGNVVLTVKILRGMTGAGGRRRTAPAPADEEECEEGEYLDEDGWCVSGDEIDGDEVDGTVTALAPDASALTLAPEDGSDATTIPVSSPDLLDGIDVGDDVAVTLGEDGIAIDVELLDWVEDPGDDGADE